MDEEEERRPEWTNERGGVAADEQTKMGTEDRKLGIEKS